MNWTTATSETVVVSFGFGKSDTSRYIKMASYKKYFGEQGEKNYGMISFQSGK